MSEVTLSTLSSSDQSVIWGLDDDALQELKDNRGFILWHFDGCMDVQNFQRYLLTKDIIPRISKPIAVRSEAREMIFSMVFPLKNTGSVESIEIKTKSDSVHNNQAKPFHLAMYNYPKLKK